jgi:hypothetical protein
MLLGEAAAAQEGLDEAEAHFAAAREAYARLGVERQLPYADLLLAWVKAARDRDAGALETVRSKTAELLEAGNTSDHAHGMVYLAEALRRLGRTGDAREALRQAQEIAARHGYGGVAARARKVEGSLDQ